MAGSGFFLGTMSPANTGIASNTLGPSMTRTIVETAFSLDVLHTATLTPLLIASLMRRETPGRRGMAPVSTNSMNSCVFSTCSSLHSSHRASSPWMDLKGSWSSQLVKKCSMRSLPPPISSSFPYNSTSHSCPMPFISKALLKDTRCPSFSVSTSTPSQSNSSASGSSTLRSASVRTALRRPRWQGAGFRSEAPRAAVLLLEPRARWVLRNGEAWARTAFRDDRLAERRPTGATLAAESPTTIVDAAITAEI
mmetsp:Transcript_5579/g.10029  ORF Transcript_5579/g.10029 Transcript_5579/m.10029 type:complete len:252 (+) Transcript_5579:308-1063(+)